ncbi:MAG: tRNA 2-thiouridine(34) synthase MnmA, partial [Ileibacterium sp.]|nr:tRNA 2-thiouridine(34) synthase MnmA [Ileibacterium sp.]
YVARNDHKDWLISDCCLVKNINWLHPDPKSIPTEITAKFRYRQPDQNISIEWVDDTSLLVHYPQGIASVTPGQEAVFYNGDICLGGGVIEQVFQNGEDLMEKIQKKGMEANV